MVKKLAFHTNVNGDNASRGMCAVIIAKNDGELRSCEIEVLLGSINTCDFQSSGQITQNELWIN